MKKLLICFVKLYQKKLSPYIGGGCYYEPTCSEYMKLALAKYGSIRGLIKGLKRLCSCRPGCAGGVDYP
jgi:hypothetical protein